MAQLTVSHFWSRLAAVADLTQVKTWSPMQSARTRHGVPPVIANLCPFENGSWILDAFQDALGESSMLLVYSYTCFRWVVDCDQHVMENPRHVWWCLLPLIDISCETHPTRCTLSPDNTQVTSSNSSPPIKLLDSAQVFLLGAGFPIGQLATTWVPREVIMEVVPPSGSRTRLAPLWAVSSLRWFLWSSND